MIRWSFRLSSISGVPIRIHWSFVVFIAVLAWLTGMRHGHAAAFGDLQLILGVVLSIILHEIGHALTARWRGLGVREICLYPFGGVTVYDRTVPAGMDEILVALAGPLANVLLTAVLWVLLGWHAPLPEAPGTPGFSLPASLFWANAFLSLFNLIPVLPLDGGSILRGLLAPRLGTLRASQITGQLGRITGLALLITAGTMSNIWLGLAGVFIFLGAASELQQIKPIVLLSRQTAGDLMNPNVIEVAPGTPIGTLKSLLSSSPVPDAVVVSGEAILGFIPAGKILTLPETENAGDATSATLITPLGVPIQADMPLAEALERLSTTGRTHAPVIDGRGRLRGIVSLDALQRAHSLLESLRERRLS